MRHNWEKDPEEEDLSLQITSDEIIDDLVAGDLDGVIVDFTGYGMLHGEPFTRFLEREQAEQTRRLKEYLYER